MKGLKCLILKLHFFVLALLLSFSLCFITTLNASASSQGVFWSNSFSAQRYLSGNSSPLNISGAFTPVYNKDFSSWIGFPNDFSNYSDLCFNFPGLSIDSDPVNYTLSVSYTVQNGRVFSLNSTPETSNSPLNQVTSSSFGDSLNNLFDVGTDITNYNSEYTATMSVSGILSKSSGTSSRVCFGGLFGQGVKKSVGDGITIHQPFISIYKSEDSKINDSILDQTTQQQEQYEQEKQEEADRENQSSEDADKLGGAFSFTFLNPFIGIFELFNPSGCISIPTIAGMVGSENSTYCPWFSNSTRNVLTPVIGLAGSMLLFGFVVRGFLNKGNFSGGIEI